MKNPYSKFIKYLEKQTRVLFQRSGDSVYLTDGMVALKVPVMIYDSLIRPLSGILPDTTDDCMGEKRDTDNVVKITAHGRDIKQMVESISTKETVAQTRFLIELPPKGKSKRNFMARVFSCGKEIIVINERLVDIVTDFPVEGTWKSAGTWKDPVVWQDENATVVLMPMRVNNEYFEVWSNVKSTI